MNKQKCYDTEGNYEVSVIQYLDDVTVEICSPVDCIELSLQEVIELYELLPCIIADAKNYKKKLNMNQREELERKMAELQKELDRLG